MPTFYLSDEEAPLVGRALAFASHHASMGEGYRVGLRAIAERVGGGAMQPALAMVPAVRVLPPSLAPSVVTDKATAFPKGGFMPPRRDDPPTPSPAAGKCDQAAPSAFPPPRRDDAPPGGALAAPWLPAPRETVAELERQGIDARVCGLARQVARFESELAALQADAATRRQFVALESQVLTIGNQLRHLPTVATARNTLEAWERLNRVEAATGEALAAAEMRLTALESPARTNLAMFQAFQAFAHASETRAADLANKIGRLEAALANMAEAAESNAHD